MNYKMMGRLDALILAVEAVFMLPAFLISLFMGEQAAAQAFLVSMGIILAVAAILAFLSRKAKRDFYAREGLICVGTSWLLLSLLGALPLVFSGAVPNYIYALFEMVSGFTTTGSSIIPDLDVIPRGIIYWRSFSNWLGGMGVLVFLMAILPVSGQSEGFTMHLLRAESPGPDVGKLVPRMRDTAAVLYLSYFALSLINLIFLLCGGMPIFDAVCTMFSTAGTGGFGIYNDSFAGFSPYIQVVTTVFMFLFGINFSCYYLILLRKFGAVLRDEELRLYIGIVVASIVLIAWNVYSLYGTLAATLQHSSFQVVSIITTTGFTSTGLLNQWPSFSQGILLFLMAIGACAGSTAGGLKCARLLLLLKSFRRNVAQILRPKKIMVIRVNEKPIDEKTISNTGAYFVAYIAIMVVSFLIVSLDGASFMTNFSTVLSCFNNIGFSFFDVSGPVRSCMDFSIASKLVLIVDMLAGRLEIFPILVLFMPHAWKRG